MNAPKSIRDSTLLASILSRTNLFLKLRSKLAFAIGGRILSILFFIPLAMGVNPATSFIENSSFQGKFNDAYNKMNLLDMDTLTFYLESAIEDLFLVNHHVSANPLTSEIDFFQHSLVTNLKPQLCEDSSIRPPNPKDLQGIIVKAVLMTHEDLALDVSLDMQQAGWLSGIIFRILGKIPERQICDIESFSDAG